ncbi:hypothetical protein [Ornithinimicrobium sp. Y1694]|uniref:hypothetical protein n=1 Tax=Ornithinimicrobium sp. Y1694 TaxID=3418590 RepID=UPI003CEE4ECC
MTKLRHLSARKQPRMMTWVPVKGPDGRTRMEMRWHVGQKAPKNHRSSSSSSAA